MSREKNRVVDLTLTLGEEIPGVDFEQMFTVAKDGWNARLLKLYSHVGTHMDAPHHFEAGPQTIDTIPLDRCVTRAWIADIGQAPARMLIEPRHLGAVEDNLSPGDSLLLKTGWSRHFGSDTYRDDLPRVSLALAQWCVDRKVNILGVEPPSVADVNNLEEVTQVHLALLGGGVIIVEGLTNLDCLQSNPVQFTALPLKLRNGDGSPARAFAVDATP